MVTRRPGSATVEPAVALRLPEVLVPGDISSAAPFLVAAALLPGSSVTVHDLGLNPLRTGLLDVLERMGARVGILNRRSIAGEAIGDVEVGHGELVATTIGGAEIPRLVDELPLIALLASMAHGTTTVTGAAELRAKESDRIDAVVTALRAIGAACRGPARRLRHPRRAGAPARRRDRLGRATTGSRCSPRSPASSPERASASPAPSAAEISFPGFYDVLASLVETGEIETD